MEVTRGGDKNSDSTLKTKKSPNNQRSSDPGSDGENSRDDSSTTCSKVAIPDDDLIVQILARLDGPSYSQALYQDARSINKNFLVPPYFPWHSRKRLPQKVVKTLPRDIDDLHVITHCQDELHAPFGDFQGPFGFGRYENGQSRGNYSNVPPSETLSLNLGSHASDSASASAAAAARRSQDPGVLELSTRIPLPSFIDAVMNGKDPHAPTPAATWKAELSKDPDNKMLSYLPFHWGKGGECPYSVFQHTNHSASGKQGPDAKFAESDVESRKLAESRSRSRAQIDLASSCMRKWKISFKVGGVSSRSTLFPSSSVTDTYGDQVPENTRKVVRPMLCLASLPQSIQSGETVSMEKAMELDKAGLAHSLGSYDCRFTDALLNPKRDGASRGKRIEVGRTRLMWSNLIQDEPLPSTRNRANFNSLITGQRFDPIKCRRPTEVKVGVRLNGRIIMEEALEDLPSTAGSIVRKRKHSTRQAENEGPVLKSRTQCPESRTDEEIDAALHINPQEDRVLEQSTANGSVVYLEMGESSSHSDIDRNDIIATLLKFNQKKSGQKKLKSSTSSDNMSIEAVPVAFGGSQVIKKSNPPRFACLPIEDGLMRTVCLSAGNMTGAAVHQVIREVSEQESERRCSVCWSDEGFGKEGVLECIKCGLLVHSNCCRDNGEFSSASGDPTSKGQPLGPPDKKQKQLGNTNGAAKHPNAQTQVDMECSENEQWQCAVCCRYTDMKPRRNPRMPSRFDDGETYTSSTNTGDNNVASRNANMPGPQCSLCPHRGGAMSLLDSSHGSDKWAHEICRVWTGLDLFDNAKKKDCSSLFGKLPLSNVCALCGTGAAGLTRCAARGCFVAFHPMCALLASKVGADEKVSKSKSVRTRKTRHTDQAVEEKKSDVNEAIESDKKLCKMYTLQLVQLSRTDRAVGKEDKTAILPVAFCGIHNPKRDDSFFGCLPGGVAV